MRFSSSLSALTPRRLVHTQVTQAEHRRITTERLDIVQLSVPDVEALIDGRPQQVERLLNASFPKPFVPPPLMDDALPFICDWLRDHPNGHWWKPWFFAERERRMIAGSAGFSGPSECGALQLGYAVYPEYQKLGYATETARALIQEAWTDASITAVQATIPPWHADSIRVAEKLGMTAVGETTDDEVGKIIVYEITRA
jgi:RimJ/RimL family protein N-acetyltransferase